MPMIVFSLYCFKMNQNWHVFLTLLGTIISLTKSTFEDDFPAFHRWDSSLEGKSIFSTGEASDHFPIEAQSSRCGS